MVAINFKARFADKVERGDKRQTIRRERKRPIKAGDALQFFKGDRFHPEKIGEAVCKSVERIEINFLVDEIYIGDVNTPEVLSRHGKALDTFARADGFDHWLDMREWFRKTHGRDAFSFVGVLIKW